ncbi:hypothetical protein B6D19_05870 [Gilliamella apicola]|uniref:hypothetical protein n=1 Tax=Gilliamella apicola TaxID=1196095 RepID=UPI000A342E1D|nr:hypothetical protein [Gilliamella apicola]OTQ32279.1 hypothetical protein B6D19_05870 [Gilliamella apicola]OTQ46725.1 hypothetical protein B6D20_01940 [Gilliamella apicola]
MKNLTIKKVAFGLLLAGYASSSAFAATLSASTSQLILGNAPVLSKTSGDAEHTVSVTFTTDEAGSNPVGANENVQVGNYMRISYNLLDKDGDADNGNIKESLTVYAKVNGTWKTFKADALNVKADAGNNENGRQSGFIVIEIDNNFAGAEQIGFRLQERTEFGLPNTNQWLNISDVWSSANPEVTDGVEPSNPPSSDAGPGDKAPGVGPILSSTFKVGIFKYTSSNSLDTSVNYATANVNPQYGEKFAAVVWNDVDGNNEFDAGEAEFTSAYKYKWSLSDSYAGVDAVTTEELASTTTQAEGDTIYLGSDSANHNSIYNTGYKAGAQGYRLKVETR